MTKILIAIGGAIAAYKVCEVVSSLYQQGIEVRTVLTDSAHHFIAPLSLSTLSRHRVYTDQDFWAPTHSRPLHIELGEWADLILIAPVTANTLAKLAYGMADNLLTNIILASTCPVLLAPGMNTDMWEQVTVQENKHKLSQISRYHFIGPAAGLLACDRVGMGRLAEPNEILSAISSLIYTKGKRDLRNKNILITAGGTREHLDPVRFIGNPATGKMGIALARAALHRGAQVKLIAANIPLEDLPPNDSCVRVVSSEDMRQAVLSEFPHCDWLMMSGAVGDVKPKHYHNHKLPKNQLPSELSLEPIPDILTQLIPLKQPHQQVIGFAANTGDFITQGRRKLHDKQLNAIAANPIDQPNTGFGSEYNQGIFLSITGQIQEIPPCSKLEYAHLLLDFVMLLS